MEITTWSKVKYWASTLTNVVNDPHSFDWRQYLDVVASEINATLQEKGMLQITDLVSRFNLDLHFLTYVTHSQITSSNLQLENIKQIHIDTRHQWHLRGGCALHWFLHRSLWGPNKRCTSTWTSSIPDSLLGAFIAVLEPIPVAVIQARYKLIQKLFLRMAESTLSYWPDRRSATSARGWTRAPGDTARQWDGCPLRSIVLWVKSIAVYLQLHRLESIHWYGALHEDIHTLTTPVYRLHIDGKAKDHFPFGVHCIRHIACWDCTTQLLRNGSRDHYGQWSPRGPHPWEVVDIPSRTISDHVDRSHRPHRLWFNSIWQRRINPNCCIYVLLSLKTLKRETPRYHSDTRGPDHVVAVRVHNVKSRVRL